MCIGEAMEQGLRDCCRSIRIGKILIQSDEDTHEAHVVYAKFPEDIASRKVLLMYPIMSKYAYSLNLKYYYLAVVAFSVVCYQFPIYLKGSWLTISHSNYMEECSSPSI